MTSGESLGRHAETGEIAMPQERTCDDFEFLAGRWRVTNRRLRERLVGSTEWDEFELDYEFQSMLGGLANVDRLYGDLNGERFEGMSVRTYDPARDEWTIFWADVHRPQLSENVRGRFEDGVGTFFGIEEIGGTRYILRFRWQSSAPGTARWEQAFFDPATDSWETNWIMIFRRA